MHLLFLPFCGTSDQPCWLAEACIILLFLLLYVPVMISVHRLLPAVSHHVVTSHVTQCYTSTRIIESTLSSPPDVSCLHDSKHSAQWLARLMG